VISDDADRLLDFLSGRLDKRVPYSVIRARFEWGEGARFSRRLSEARKAATVRGMALSYALWDRASESHCCVLTKVEASPILRGDIPRVSTVGGYLETIGAHGAFIRDHATVEAVRQLGDIESDMATSLGRQLRKFAKLAALLDGEK
jgi:hypothetical protein